MATKKKDELTTPLSGVSESTAQKLAEYQAGYKQGENVTNAYNEYNTLKQNAPGAYVSQYQGQLDDLYNKITNRGPFKYDLNGDMLWQNAKEQYQQMGKQAMVDTIGQATQLTGGYGNSYAQNVGNQAYQQWLTRLNEKIPEYYNLAMQRYNMEGDELNNQYGMLRDRENEEYGRYRDTVSDYNQNLQMAYNVYNNERDDDYGKYRDALDYWQNQAGAENKDYWTQTQFDYQKEQDAIDQAFREKQLAQEMAYKYAALARSGSGGGGGGTKKEPEEKPKTQDQLASEVLKLVTNRFVSSTAAGLNNIGLGIRLSAEDAIKAQEQQEANSGTKNLLLESARGSFHAPMAEKYTELKKMDFGALNGTKAENVQKIYDTVTRQLVLNNVNGKSNADLLRNTTDTLAYYYNNGYITQDVAEEALNKLAKALGR